MNTATTRHEFIEKDGKFYARNRLAIDAMKFLAGDRHCLTPESFRVVSDSIQESGFEVHVAIIAKEGDGR